MDLKGLSAKETAAKLNEEHPRADAEKGLHDDHLAIGGDYVGVEAFLDLRDAGWYVSGSRGTVTYLHR